MSIKKRLNFLELLFKKKITPCNFLIDETYLVFYFFHNFLDVYVVPKKNSPTQQRSLQGNLLIQRVYFRIECWVSKLLIYC